MLTVNLFDNTCQHHLREDGYWTSTEGRRPKNIKFIQKLMSFDGITLFTDDYILSEEVDRVTSKYKIAWCLESPAVKPYIHKNIEKVEHKFDYLLTYRDDLIKSNPKKYLPNSPGGTYINDSDINSNHVKNKNCSMIISGKKDLEGHILRHLIQKSAVGIDFFGWGTKGGFLKYKGDVMKDYKYHITIENTRAHHYFSEKLIDCLLLKCIPIYWGCLNIEKYFNIDGFILFKDIYDLSKIKLSKTLYEEKYDVVLENFRTAKKYISSDDYLASKLIKL